MGANTMMAWRIRIDGKRFVPRDFKSEKSALFSAPLYEAHNKVEIVKMKIEILETKEIKV